MYPSHWSMSGMTSYRLARAETGITFSSFRPMRLPSYTSRAERIRTENKAIEQRAEIDPESRNRCQTKREGRKELGAFLCTVASFTYGLHYGLHFTWHGQQKQIVGNIEQSRKENEQQFQRREEESAGGFTRLLVYFLLRYYSTYCVLTCHGWQFLIVTAGRKRKENR